MSQKPYSNPRDKWTAPEHARGHSCFRASRDYWDKRGNLVVRRNTLFLSFEDLVATLKEAGINTPKRLIE